MSVTFRGYRVKFTTQFIVLKDLLNVFFFVQLGKKVGHGWVHYDDKKQRQPMWNCHRCELSTGLKTCCTS